MEGNSNDGSGNARDGSDTDISYIAGRFGKAASFNGSSSYIELPANIVPKTVLLHANFYQVAATAYFLGMVGGSSSGIRYNGSTFLVYTFHSATGFVAVPWTKVDAMVHFAAVNTSGYLWDIYIEGEKIGTGTSGVGGSLEIGQFGRRDTSYYFNGPMDEIAFFDRTLTETDIRRVMMGMHPIS